MKGTVLKCIEKIVIENFGLPTWEKCLTNVGLDEDHVFMLNDDVDEALTMKLVTDVIPRNCNLTIQQVLDTFGHYWINHYVTKMYSPYLEGCQSTKDLILKLDYIHQTVTKNIPDSRPPWLKYEWINENKLALSYISERGLIDLFISIAHAAGAYYNEKLNITRKSDQALEIDFAA